MGDAKKLLNAFGGTFSEPDTVMKHLRIDEVVCVRTLFCIEHVGYAVVRRDDNDTPIPSEALLREERERQTDERIKAITDRANIDRGHDRVEDISRHAD